VPAEVIKEGVKTLKLFGFNVVDFAALIDFPDDLSSLKNR
jgi:hypothetical protein